MKHQITAIRTERPYGHEHEHITMVELDANPYTRIPRSEVITNLRNPWGDRYYTNAGGALADVIVVGCPYCIFREYITTEPDWTKANNLLSLRRF